MVAVALKNNNLQIAEFNFEDDGFSTKCRSGHNSPAGLSIVDNYLPERNKIENFIKSVYSEAYGAKIIVNYPNLLSVQCKDKRILSAIGFRRCSKGSKLYLEGYLAEPIEKEIYRITNNKVERKKIVEVGNLASKSGQSSMFLFAAVISYLSLTGAKYVVFTGTSFLARYFRILGIGVTVISEADKDKVKGCHNQWGTYFDHSPKVYIGDLSKSSEVLKRVFHSEIKILARHFLQKINLPTRIKNN